MNIRMVKTNYFLKEIVYIYEYESVDLRKMKKDEQLLSLLSSQKIGARLYLNASKKALAVNNKLKELIDSELEN